MDKKTSVDFSFILASSVHDMKNSVGMLLQTLEAISVDRTPGSSLSDQQLGILGYEASRINSELVQLLALYRMEQQSMPMQIDECNIDEILSEQMARNELMFTSRGITLDYHCDPELYWYVDAELLGGVVNNLLVNAARYCHQTVRLLAKIKGSLLHIAIADDGGGFPQKMLDAPIEPHAGVSFTTGSTNLGLLFATQVAKLHVNGAQQGRLCLSNGGELGGGIVEVLLP
ncbi:MAG TPA: HAMP domain-containing sensor histidine kinase [Cellvibrionaceae bacterium]